jgi:hypothetical protein
LIIVKACSALLALTNLSTLPTKLKLSQIYILNQKIFKAIKTKTIQAISSLILGDKFQLK